MSSEYAPRPQGRGRRAAGTTAQVVGVIGIVLSVILAIGVLLGRGWLVDRVNEIAATVDSQLARGVPLLDAASARVGDVQAKMSTLADAATAVASNPDPAPGLVDALRGHVTTLSDRYLAFRQGYADARETAVATLERLNTIDRLVPFISIPQGPVDALAALDARLRAADARIMEIADADLASGAVSKAAAGIAEKAGNVESALGAVSAGIDDTKARLANLRTEVQGKADQVNTIITIVAIVLVLAFLYSVLLHWVLFRAGRDLRRRRFATPSGESGPAPTPEPIPGSTSAA